MKIMVVEDDAALREIYGIRITAEGYEVIPAGDGEEALTKVIQAKPDLILADVMMPKISGFDMLDIIRNTPETANTKVILMTALSGDDQRARGENLGANRYLVKSQVGIEDVIRIINETIGAKNVNSNYSPDTQIIAQPQVNTAPGAPAPINQSPSPIAAPAAPIQPSPEESYGQPTPTQ